LTVQPRIAAGSLAFTEIPAGMLDGDTKFAGKAAKEIKEEADLEVKEAELLDMTKLALSDVQADGVLSSESLAESMYPSPGACDEFIPLMLCQKRLSRTHMESLKGKATGLKNEGEQIKLKLVPLTRLWKEAARDGKALAALSLYENLKREGKIPEMPGALEEEPNEFP
jgi:ADP-sugar diphosphatase